MNCKRCGESTSGQNVFNGGHRHLPDCIDRLKERIAKPIECAWKPIDELGDDGPTAVLMRLEDGGLWEMGLFLGSPIDREKWTHFAPIPELTTEDALRLIREMELRKTNA